MRRSTVLIAISAVVAALPPFAAAPAQRRPPVAASVGPAAVGAPAPTPTPIGGLRTTPIPPAGARGPRGTGVSVARGFERFGGGMVPLLVADAPVTQSGVVITAQGTAYGTPAMWTPTAERPRWVQDSSVAPVQAWRDLIVTDVVCNRAATCVERRQRVRARWVASCACYAFADAWNRIWRVE